MIELLVVTAVSGLIVAGVLVMVIQLLGLMGNQAARAQNQDDGRLAMYQVTRYVRAATNSADHTLTWSNAVATAQPQNLEFYCDVDGDGLSEKVRYYLSGTNLKMQTGAPYWVADPPAYHYPDYQTDGLVVQDGVRNASTALFTYYRLNGDDLQAFTPTTASQRADIVVIDVYLKINQDPVKIGRDVVLSSRVQLRQRYNGGLEQ